MKWFSSIVNDAMFIKGCCFAVFANTKNNAVPPEFRSQFPHRSIEILPLQRMARLTAPKRFSGGTVETGRVDAICTVFNPWVEDPDPLDL